MSMYVSLLFVIFAITVTQRMMTVKQTWAAMMHILTFVGNAFLLFTAFTAFAARMENFAVAALGVAAIFGMLYSWTALNSLPGRKSNVK